MALKACNLLYSLVVRKHKSKLSYGNPEVLLWEVTFRSFLLHRNLQFGFPKP
jgi:hypothetical protein